MTGPLRPCNRPGCRLCRPETQPDESLAVALVGMAAIVVLFIVVFVLLPA